MKHLIVTMLLTVAVNLFAAVQYGMNIEQTNELVSAGFSSNAWTVTALKNVTLHLNTSTSDLAKINGHMKSVVGNLVSGAFAPLNTGVGYFTYNAAMNQVGGEFALDFKNGFDSISLGAGETIGFWVEVGGKKYYSVSGVDGLAYNSKVFGGGDTGKSGKVYNYGNGWYLANGISYGYEQSLLIGVEQTTTGQPLPGILATLLAGGGVFLIRRRRR